MHRVALPRTGSMWGLLLVVSAIEFQRMKTVLPLLDADWGSEEPGACHSEL